MRFFGGTFEAMAPAVHSDWAGHRLSAHIGRHWQCTARRPHGCLYSAAVREKPHWTHARLVRKTCSQFFFPSTESLTLRKSLRNCICSRSPTPSSGAFQHLLSRQVLTAEISTHVAAEEWPLKAKSYVLHDLNIDMENRHPSLMPSKSMAYMAVVAAPTPPQKKCQGNMWKRMC